MLVVDMEATGLDPVKNSVISIGAVDFSDPTRKFYQECRAFDGAEINPEALAVNGFSEKDCFDPNKKSLEETMKIFYEWIQNTKGDKIIAGQNAFYDREILNNSFKRANINFAFHFRLVELHSVAYYDMVKKGLVPPKKEGFSAFSLDKILNYVGLPEEPKPHNALTGAKLEAEAFSRLFYGKNMLEEFKKYPIPESFLR